MSDMVRWQAGSMRSQFRGQNVIARFGTAVYGSLLCVWTSGAGTRVRLVKIRNETLNGIMYKV